MIWNLVIRAVRAVARRVFTRRFACFLLPWLVIAAVPPLRQTVQGQFAVNTFADELSQRGYGRVYAREENDPFSAEYLLRRYPGNIDVQSLAAFEPGLNGVGTFDKAIEQHPEIAWPIAMRWRFGDGEAAALQGRRLEPGNLFFDWMLMRELLDTKREADAMAIFESAAKKPYFDSHVREFLAARLRGYGHERRMTIEEKSSVFKHSLSYMNTPASALPQLVLERARRARQRGDHKLALDYLGKLMHLYATIRQGEDSLLLFTEYAYIEPGHGFYVASATLTLWIRAIDDSPQTISNRLRSVAFRKALLLHAKRFAGYARLHGRPDIADLAMSEAKALLAGRTMPPDIQDGGFFPAHVVSVSLQHRIWFLLSLTQICVTCLTMFLWLRLGLALPLWTPGLRSEPLRSTDLRRTRVFFTLSAVAVLAAMGLSQGGQEEYDPQTYLSFMNLCFVPAMVLFGAVIAVAVTVWRDRVKIFGPRAPEPGLPGEHVPRSLLPLVMTVVSWVVLAFAAICWMATAWLYFQPEINITIPIPSPLESIGLGTAIWVDKTFVAVSGNCFAAAAYAVWLLRWRWMAPHDLKPIAHYAVRWHLYSLGDLAIVLSFMFLAISITTLQVRSAAGAELSRFLAHGKSVAARNSK